MPGSTISSIEIMGVSKEGFALRVGDEKLSLSFADFPWFRHATLQQLAAVEWPAPGRLHWPELDIDLALDSIRDPAAFPRVAKSKTPEMKTP